ncbi:ACT domain-containing protein ACR1-like, partial [Dendrobium catenatum]|uniref:ACT domain-containing protein ACR1-like n=1 Tax=Dendrobium catenatum TaxID=906689 RepID=UPI0010A06A5F
MAEGSSNFSVCVDNETYEDSTLLRVEGENVHGILLQIVQALSDLDLIISKATISADSGWFMNVFHVTDHHGHKLRDPNFIRYIQRSLDGDQEGNGSYDITQLKICRDNKVNVEQYFASDCIALEISCVDIPGIFSKITAVLFELSFMVDTGKVWTHNGCAACILYIKDRDTGRSISDRARLSCLLKNISTVVKAHHLPDKLWGVRLRHAAYRIHTERRLHQLMQEQMDYQVTPSPLQANEDLSMLAISVVE